MYSVGQPNIQQPSLTDVPDYTKLDGPELLKALGTDHTKWAAAFRQHTIANEATGLEPDWLAVWFANALMAQHDADQAVIADLREKLDARSVAPRLRG